MAVCTVCVVLWFNSVLWYTVGKSSSQQTSSDTVSTRHTSSNESVQLNNVQLSECFGVPLQVSLYNVKAIIGPNAGHTRAAAAAAFANVYA
eukprot:12122-Heterococcus_DN1.PRE.7